ncbi:hypothetical protein CH375_01605 [Leptospira ellisii]|nr:hypothetical protein CH375_01605 [Leptospira ellisii]
MTGRERFRSGLGNGRFGNCGTGFPRNKTVLRPKIPKRAVPRFPFPFILPLRLFDGSDRARSF